MKLADNDLPIVYSCSGCSSAAQMANQIAIKLDRTDVAEMSCIAGVGGNVKKLVKTAKAGRKIVVIDGCPLACSKACLSNHDIVPDLHYDLSKMGVKKVQHQDFDPIQADEILQEITKNIDAMKEEQLFADVIS
ncbi:MAG: putative zinc-binding protein [Bacteroidetes bacterium]|nr:putative zinc-binding protein [Bacteroidota bacterium]